MGGDLGVAALCLLVYLLCGQRTLHGTDSENLVLWLKAGDRYAYPRHVAFLPLTCSLYSLLQPLGVSAFRTLLLASACGSALGVFAITRAARWLLPTYASPRSAALMRSKGPGAVFSAPPWEAAGRFAGGRGGWWGGPRGTSPAVSSAGRSGASAGRPVTFRRSRASSRRRSHLGRCRA